MEYQYGKPKEQIKLNPDTKPEPNQINYKRYRFILFYRKREL